jgi:hypothetical protein
MASETVHLAPVIKATTESIEALYFALNGTPDLSNLFNELQTQLQAMKTLLRLLDMVPDTVALNTDIINLVEKFGDSCVPVRESIERVSQHDNPDWTVFRNGPEDTAAIVRKLRMYMASIVIGGLQDLESVFHHANVDKTMR